VRALRLSKAGHTNGHRPDRFTSVAGAGPGAGYVFDFDFGRAGGRATRTSRGRECGGETTSSAAGTANLPPTVKIHRGGRFFRIRRDAWPRRQGRVADFASRGSTEPGSAVREINGADAGHGQTASGGPESRGSRTTCRSSFWWSARHSRAWGGAKDGHPNYIFFSCSRHHARLTGGDSRRVAFFLTSRDAIFLHVLLCYSWAFCGQSHYLRHPAAGAGRGKGPDCRPRRPVTAACFEPGVPQS